MFLPSPTQQQTCALNSIGASGCPVTNVTCICVAPTFISSFNSCVGTSCNATDQAGESSLPPLPHLPLSHLILPFHSHAPLPSGHPIRHPILRRSRRELGRTLVDRGTGTGRHHTCICTCSYCDSGRDDCVRRATRVADFRISFCLDFYWGGAAAYGAG